MSKKATWDGDRTRADKRPTVLKTVTLTTRSPMLATSISVISLDYNRYQNKIKYYFSTQILVNPRICVNASAISS